MQAHLLSTNDFSMPLVYDKSNAEYINIMYLLYLTKGKYQSHPDMGVGLRERYRFALDDALLYALREDVKKQIQQYLPQINVIQVETVIQNNILGIIISTASGAYVLAYDKENDVMDVGSKYILNNL